MAAPMSSRPGHKPAISISVGTVLMYTVRVEITDNYGNVAIGSQAVDVSKSCATDVGPNTIFYLPLIHK